ncbi:MAG TPA: type II toxin-antitoxin system prevent-host-death family antitoxin [Gemmatimonadaceae bacterium]
MAPPKKKRRTVREPVSLYDAKTHLSELVDLASSGHEITISKSGKPKARLVPLDPGQGRNLRIPGQGKGIRVARDFDAPLPAGLLELFGESPE